MARGPLHKEASRQLRIKRAEELLDACIGAEARDRIEVPVVQLSLRAPEEWNQHLRQKYLDAGWTKAEWVPPHETQHSAVILLEA